MNRSEPAKAVSGRATGALFFIGFGSLWLSTGLSALHRLNSFSAVGVAIVAAALVVPAVRLLRRAGRLSQANAGSAEKAKAWRVFRVVNIIQWTGVVAAVILLNIFHLREFIVPAIATIVGFHLFPLARVFRYSVHYVTGTLLVLWSVGVVLAVPREKLPSLGALGTATILLVSAAYTLTIATRDARQY
jgi:hypothetical protein